MSLIIAITLSLVPVIILLLPISPAIELGLAPTGAPMIFESETI